VTRVPRTQPLTCVVRERPAVLVEDEPALLPGLDLSSHLDQEAPARLIGDGQLEAGVRAVSGRLDVAVEIEVVLPHGEVASQPRLRRERERREGWRDGGMEGWRESSRDAPEGQM